jgi:hypothetical protein
MFASLWRQSPHVSEGWVCQPMVMPAVPAVGAQETDEQRASLAAVRERCGRNVVGNRAATVCLPALPGHSPKNSPNEEQQRHQ